MKAVKPISIDRRTYAMEMSSDRHAVLTMYGQIVERQPTNWWTGEPIPGNYIIQDEFLADLDRISKAKTLTIRMNSLGGDAGVSILIHNRLRELAAKGTSLTCIVDGVAMSGGSLIMSACDTVKVNPSSLIMIHQCWSSLFGGYNATELREEAAACEAWDKAQASIYKRKCGLDEAEIACMMAATTYMTGQEAVDKGFADALMEDAEPLNIAASADGRSLFVRGKEFHLCPGIFAPDSIPTASTDMDGMCKMNMFSEMRERIAREVDSERPRRAYDGAKSEVKSSVANTNTEGGNKTMTNIVTPDAAQTAPIPAVSATTPAVQETAPAPAVDQVAAERQRLKEIDAIAALYDPALVETAKYGENPCTAQELTYKAAVAAAAKAAGEGSAFLAAMAADSQVAAQVGAVPATEPPKSTENMTPEQRMANARNEVKALLGKKEG